jgi:hypothetical protein
LIPLQDLVETSKMLTIGQHIDALVKSNWVATESTLNPTKD